MRCSYDYEMIRDVQYMSSGELKEEMGGQNGYSAPILDRGNSLISVTVGVTLTSTPEYPSSASSRSV